MIRKAREEDLLELTILWKSLSEEQENIDFQVDEEAADIWRDYAKKHLYEKGFGILVNEEEGIDGFVMYEPRKAIFKSDVRKGYISDIYVRPEKRRRGIAKGLMIEALKIMKEEYDRVQLQVFSNNEGAIRLYRSLGFKDFSLILDYSFS